MIDPEVEAAAIAEEIDAELDASIDDGLFAEEKRAAAIGAAIEADLARRDAIGLYLDEKRQKAMLAIKTFPDIDIDDKAGLRACQTAVRMYLDVFGFVREHLIHAAEARAVLTRELGHPTIPDDNQGTDDG